jgi:hypothetical protein
MTTDLFVSGFEGKKTCNVALAGKHYQPPQLALDLCCCWLLFRDVGGFDTPAEPFSDFIYSSGLKCQLSLAVCGVRALHRRGTSWLAAALCVLLDLLLPTAPAARPSAPQHSTQSAVHTASVDQSSPCF